MIADNKAEKKKNKEESNTSSFFVTIYEVLFILLKEEDAGVIKLALLRLIDFCQLMAFPFNEDAQFPWRAGDFYATVEAVLQVFQIINYLSNFPWFAYLLVF